MPLLYLLLSPVIATLLIRELFPFSQMGDQPSAMEIAVDENS